MTATLIKWLETDTNSNIDISGATLIGTYTADADRLIMCDVLADAVAGDGDYVMYLTKQLAGAGSSYVILPKTTMTAAAGETAIGGQSGWINVRNTDVVKCYIDGLAGDTTTPDTTVRWFEGAAVEATLADNAITSDKFDESTAYPLKSADTGATAVARTGADSDTLETLSDQMDTIAGYTDDIGVAGAGLTAVPWNAAWDAEVQSEATDALNAYDPPTNAEMEARTIVSASYALQTSVDDLEGRLTAARAGYLDNLSAGAVALEATATAIKAKTDNLPGDPADESSLEAAITAATSPLATAAAVAALNNLSAAEVNAEVVDALNVDTYAEPGLGAPAATASLAAKINYLYKSWRNKKTQTMTTRSIYNDAGSTVDQQAADSDDGTTFTKGEIGSG